MADNDNQDRLMQIVGNAGGGPETTQSGKVKVSVAVTLKYGKEDGETRWVSAWIKDESLQQFAMDEIGKGTKVAAIGYLNKGSYNGKTQYNLNVTEIGIVEMARRGDRQKKAEPEQTAESEELGW